MIYFFAFLDLFCSSSLKINAEVYFIFKNLIKYIFLDEGGSGYVAGTP